MHSLLTATLTSALLLFASACGTSTATEPSYAALFDSNQDQVPDRADTTGDGKADLALGNLCQLVCDGSKLTGIDVDCDGEVDFDVAPIELPAICEAGGGGGGSGGGSGSGGGGSTSSACASSLDDRSVSCERTDAAPWACVCVDAGVTRNVSYDGDDACSIPGGACF